MPKGDTASETSFDIVDEPMPSFLDEDMIEAEAALTEAEMKSAEAQAEIRRVQDAVAEVKLRETRMREQRQKHEWFQMFHMKAEEYCPGTSRISPQRRARGTGGPL